MKRNLVLHFKEIINRYGLDLNAEWNEIRNEKQKIINNLNDSLRDAEIKTNQSILEKDRIKLDLGTANNKLEQIVN